MPNVRVERIMFFSFRPWAHVGPMLALCWPMLALAWPMLALSWPYVGPMLTHLRLKDLQDANFSFPDPSAEPKPRKNNVFSHFADAKVVLVQAHKTP